MSIPFKLEDVVANAELRGFCRIDAIKLASVAFHQLQHLQHIAPTGQRVTAADVAEALKLRASKEAERASREEADLQALGIVVSDAAVLGNQVMEDAQDITDYIMEDRHGQVLEEKVSVEKDHLNGVSNKKFKFMPDGLDKFFGGTTPYNPENDMNKLSLKHTSHDIITALCQHVEIAVEIGKHLRPRDVLNLYSVSRSFNEAISSHMFSSIKAWVSLNAPDAGRIFNFRLYRRHLIPDPSGRTWVGQDPSAQSLIPSHQRNDARLIPGIKYLQLVLGRVRCCREIIAILARNGHRLPKGMLATLVRLWLLMEVSTTAQRQALLHSQEIWTERDLFNVQFFLVKLGMHFIDPVFGPASTELVNLMMGQKGLYPLWQLLMCNKYTELSDFLELKVRYDYQISPTHWTQDIANTEIFGVPCHEVGIVHCEGWGEGIRHLARPDELIPMEAVTRGLELDKHLMDMVVWGYIDFSTGENLVPTEEEMYISDDENVLKHVDTRHHWKRKHTLKKRWNTLTPQQQQEIIDDDEDERLRSMAWCGDSDSEDGEEEEEEEEDECSTASYSLDDEIRRGVRLRPYVRGNPSGVPALDDNQAWIEFVNSSLLGMGADLGIEGDQTLSSMAHETHGEEELFGVFNWTKWTVNGDEPLDRASDGGVNEDDDDEEGIQEDEDETEEEAEEVETDDAETEGEEGGDLDIDDADVLHLQGQIHLPILYPPNNHQMQFGYQPFGFGIPHGNQLPGYAQQPEANHANQGWLVPQTYAIATQHPLVQHPVLQYPMAQPPPPGMLSLGDASQQGANLQGVMYPGPAPQQLVLQLQAAQNQGLGQHQGVPQHQGGNIQGAQHQAPAQQQTPAEPQGLTYPADAAFSRFEAYLKSESERQIEPWLLEQQQMGLEQGVHVPGGAQNQGLAQNQGESVQGAQIQEPVQPQMPAQFQGQVPYQGVHPQGVQHQAQHHQGLAQQQGGFTQGVPIHQVAQNQVPAQHQAQHHQGFAQQQGGFIQGVQHQAQHHQGFVQQQGGFFQGVQIPQVAQNQVPVQNQGFFQQLGGFVQGAQHQTPHYQGLAQQQGGFVQGAQIHQVAHNQGQAQNQGAPPP